MLATWHDRDGAPPVVSVSKDGDVLRADGDLSCGAPDGPWWHWDGERLVAYAGGIGSDLLFLHLHSSGIVLSTSITAIARRATLRIDTLAWTVYQYVGAYLEEDAPFANVWALGPEVRLSFDRRGLRRSFFTPPYDRETISPGAMRERFTTLLRTSVDRTVDRCQHRAAVELSGGLDSRLILYLLQGTRLDIVAVTSRKYPPDDIEERMVAQDIAARLQVRWQYVRPPTNRGAAECVAAFRQDFCSDEGAWYLFRENRRAPRGPTTWISGVGADILTGRIPESDALNAALRRSDLGRASQLIVELTRRAPLVEHLSRYLGLAPAPFKSVVERVAAELERHRRAGDVRCAFTFWNRGRRKLVPAATRLLRMGDVARLPFLDADLVRFLLSTGPRLRWGRAFQSFVMSEQGMPVERATRRGRPQASDVLAHFRKYRRELAAELKGAAIDPRCLPSDEELPQGLASPRLYAALLTNIFHAVLMRARLAR